MPRHSAPKSSGQHSKRKRLYAGMRKQLRKVKLPLRVSDTLDLPLAEAIELARNTFWQKIYRKYGGN